jgi:peptidoglycan/LPS O-acetylase OafA/YrhL
MGWHAGVLATSWAQRGAQDDRWLHDVPASVGSIGVPIFFVLSGYCIHRSQAFARARRGTFQLSSANFLVRRFFRIYPVLFGARLLTLFCDWLGRQYSPTSYKLGDLGIGAFLVNLFSLQGIAGGTYGSNDALWTLSVEVQFYALYPLLLVSMCRLGNLTTFGMLAVVNVVSYFALKRYDYELFSSYYVSWYLGALVAEGEATVYFPSDSSPPGFVMSYMGAALLFCPRAARYSFASHTSRSRSGRSPLRFSYSLR